MKPNLRISSTPILPYRTYAITCIFNPARQITAAQSVTIDYTYDPLYRLTAADYDSGEYFHYTYDSVGNRLTQQTKAGTNSYTYDIANRLTAVDGVSYTWSNNGNLLSDGESTYTYDHANRLTGVVQGEDTYSYAYNGLGDRLSQTVNGEATNYTLDTVTGLTQVLDDGANTYLYGLGRVGEAQPAGWAYHLPDALGSVRQLTDANVSVTLAQSYEPFGGVMASSGSGETSYSYTGEWADGTGLVFIRARYYAPSILQWIQPDPAVPNLQVPADLNKYTYVRNNPARYIDPTGMFTCSPMPKCREWILWTLVQLDVSGDIFSDYVYNFFMDLDEKSGGNRLNISFTGNKAALSVINYKITLFQDYMSDNFPIPIDHVGVFSHEIIHQTQIPGDRFSIWGEAQAYVFQVLVQEELGKPLTNFGKEALRLTFDLDSPGFITINDIRLREFRFLLLKTFGFNIWYFTEPLIPNYKRGIPTCIPIW